MALMTVPLDAYAIEDTSAIATPALLIYPEFVDANIQTTLRILGNDEKRWRPHIKTSKLGAVLRRLVAHDVTQFKCSTTLELQTACENGATDVLLAFPVVGANARRTVEIANRFPSVRVSVLVESLVAEDNLSEASSIFESLKPGGLLVIEGFGDPGRRDLKSPLLEGFQDLRIVSYESRDEIADWGLHKMRLERLAAEKH